MKKLLGLLLLLPLAAAEPAGYKYWSAAELKGMSHPLSNKSNALTSNQDLADWGADRALMVHREGTGSAEVHETEADVIVVVSGAGTLLVGGSMQGGKTSAPNEIRGSSINGGERQKIGPGDIFHIPPKIPHQVLLEPGAQITYFTLKVKE
jgi:mannose-6-phosphate isomerase-like protein (cupin superfamily)